MSRLSWSRVHYIPNTRYMGWFRREVNIVKTRRLFCLLLSFLLVVGSLALPAGASVTSVPESEAVITRATGRFEKNIPASSIYPVCDSSILNSGDIVSYDCSYTPRDASVKFGYIAPDGRFYYLRGSNGSIDKGIQVSAYGTYTLVIKNESDTAVYVWGTVNY